MTTAISSMRNLKSRAMTAVVLAAAMTLPTVASADPPPWAPAWGYRDRHDDHHHHYRHHWRHDDDDDDAYVYNPYYYGEPGYNTVAPAYPYQPAYSYAPAYSGPAYGACNRALLGGAIGGATGGFLGSQIGKGDGRLAATAAGAVIGLLVGQNLGRTMDQVDAGCAGQALETVPSRQTLEWRNPDVGSQYAITPMNTYETAGRYCREYSMRSIIGGRVEEVYGTACRNPDGSWQAVGS